MPWKTRFSLAFAQEKNTTLSFAKNWIPRIPSTLAKKDHQMAPLATESVRLSGNKPTEEIASRFGTLILDTYLGCIILILEGCCENMLCDAMRRYETLTKTRYKTL